MIHYVTITIIHLTDTTSILETSIASEERYDDWGESESMQQKMSWSEPKKILTTEEILKLRKGKL